MLEAQNEPTRSLPSSHHLASPSIMSEIQAVQQTEPVAPPATTVLAKTTNTLTEQFTEAEKSSVQEIITALPLIFEEAFKDLKDEKHKLEAIDMWGVPIDPLKGDTQDARVAVVLVKFLRARLVLSSFLPSSFNGLNLSLSIESSRWSLLSRCSLIL